MIYINRFLLLHLLSSFIFLEKAFAAEFECLNGQIKATYVESEKIEDIKFCVNKDRTSLRSQGCQKLECLPIKKLKSVKPGQVFSEIGTPGFKICEMIGGQPEIIKIYVDKNWYDLDRCKIKDQFVNVGILLNYISD